MTRSRYLRFEVLRTLRNRRFLMFSLAFPLILFFVVVGPNERARLDGIPFPLYYMTGMAAWGTMAAVVSSGARIAAERASGWTRQMRITPLTTSAYFRAKVLCGYLMALLSIAALGIAGTALGGPALGRRVVDDDRPAPRRIDPVRGNRNSSRSSAASRFARTRFGRPHVGIRPRRRRLRSSRDFGCVLRDSQVPSLLLARSGRKVRPGRKRLATCTSLDRDCRMVGSPYLDRSTCLPARHLAGLTARARYGCEGWTLT